MPAGTSPILDLAFLAAIGRLLAPAANEVARSLRCFPLFAVLAFPHAAAGLVVDGCHERRVDEGVVVAKGHFDVMVVVVGIVPAVLEIPVAASVIATNTQ